MIRTKIPKNIFTLVFCNKEMEQINFNIILNFEGSVTHFPGKIKLQENIPVATHMVTSVTRITEILN